MLHISNNRIISNIDFSGSQIGIGLGKNGRGVIPILWIVFAITSVLILISIIIGLVIRSRRCSFHQAHNVDNRRDGKNSMMRTTISMNGVSHYKDLY